MSSFGGGTQKYWGETGPDQVGGLEGRMDGLGYWQPALQRGLVFNNVTSGVTQPGFRS